MESVKPLSFRELEIFSLAKKLVVEIHKLTLQELPKFEMYEEGSQIRRSSKSIASNIVEGFGRRRYKHECIQFLTYSIASCDETKVHLEFLRETGSIGEEVFAELYKSYEMLGAKLYNFRESVLKAIEHLDFFCMVIYRASCIFNDEEDKKCTTEI
jgi:four helix bundle protein